MPEKVHALIIIAHPDDESFLFAGTTLKLEEEGKVVGLLCATQGEKGADRLHRNLSETEMAKIRYKELLHACNILKCSCSEFGTYPDGGLDKVDFNQLVTDLVDRINEHQPKIILTFGEEGVTGHKDHIMIGKAALAAAKEANPKPEEVWLASIPGSIIDKFNEHETKRRVHHSHFRNQPLVGVPDKKLFKMDITKYKDQKTKAIEAHESQFVSSLPLELFLENECFEIVKLA
jgi:LmbE family N-acetylglucosaminyl deacetylase